MTDYVITSGKAAQYPTKHFGGHFTGSRATFCLPIDATNPSANVLAIPTAPAISLTSSPVTITDKFFGAHIKFRAYDSQTDFFCSSVRSHDLQDGLARWQKIEPSDSTNDESVWNFRDLDAWVNANYAVGRDIVFTLFGTPDWASARPTEKNAYSDHSPEIYPYNRGLTAEPSDMAHWDRYCAKIANRYKGKIKYYEVWNEPNYQNNGTTTSGEYHYFSGTFAKLAEMVRRANQTIKAIDPDVKIICPATTAWTTTAGGTAETYFTGMLAAATGDGSTTMKDWVDIIGVHLYVSGNSLSGLAKIIDRVKAAVLTAGVSSKEIWDTESAPISPTTNSMTAAAVTNFVGRSLFIMAAKGIARTFYYQYDNPVMGLLGSEAVAHRERVRSRLLSGNITSAGLVNEQVYYATTSTNLVL